MSISNRYIESVELLIDNDCEIQEVIGFKAYHIFESLGGAFVAYLNEPIPLGHEKKINAFVANYKRVKLGRTNHQAIAKMAILLNSLRNKMLYPEVILPHPTAPKTVLEPKDQIPLKDATELFKRIKGIAHSISEIVIEDSKT